MTKPITPDEVGKEKAKAIPSFVIEAFNALISEAWNGIQAEIKQRDVVAQIDNRTCGQFQDWWLDIEPVYEAAGWKVEYDTPGYNESYPVTYIFTKKPRSLKGWRGTRP